VNFSNGPVYIDAPNFSEASNGIRCLYCFANELARQGLKISFLPRDIRGFVATVPSEFAKLGITPRWDIRAPGVLICSESIPEKTIQQARKEGIRIIWWFLAPYGLLEKQKIRPINDELILPFSSFIIPERLQFMFYQPPLDSYWQQALRKHRPRSDHKRVNIGLYCGKGRLAELPRSVLRLLAVSRITLITRNSPSTRRDLFLLLQEMDGLITFDDLSQLSLECATLGIPVFRANPLYPSHSFELFSVPIAELCTLDDQLFIEYVKKRRSRKLLPIPISSIYFHNLNTIDAVMAIISGLDNQQQFVASRILPRAIEFGRYLRSKKVLCPYYEGQSAGSYLFKVYGATLSQDPLRHKLICLIISILDELGGTAAKLGAASLFSLAVKKLKGSRMWGCPGFVDRSIGVTP
jgi:hypothetical protein